MKYGIRRENDFITAVSHAAFDSFRSNDRETNRQTRERMKKLIFTAYDNELTQRQKDCIRMYYINSMSVESIARILGIRPTTVYKHIRKGRSSLRKCTMYL